MSGLLVTGTDTGVGKTFVACALAYALRARGRRVTVMKPVETGVVDRPEDALRLQEAAGDPAPLDDICPHRLREPLAPSVAAAVAGVAIDLGRLEALIRRRLDEADVLIVEGAGGLLVPIADSVSYADVAARLRLPLLVVAANRLGTVNHCALTVRVAHAMGLDVLGIVLSQPASDVDPSAATNAATIATLTGVPVLAVLPYLSHPADAARVLRLDAILAGLQKDS
jgi:dethiobiotin synthetase